MTYIASVQRYDSMMYRRSGRRGLKLPAISLGLWHNFGYGRLHEVERAICRRAVDRGVTHFDLAETERYTTESHINLWDQTSEAS